MALPQRGITNGDALCISIACASIIAKVSRDRLMADMDAKYSGYGLSHNKGYWTEEHITGLLKLGPSAIHRRSFNPVRTLFSYVK
jgi:ribonuclease HII